MARGAVHRWREVQRAVGRAYEGIRGLPVLMGALEVGGRVEDAEELGGKEVRVLGRLRIARERVQRRCDVCDEW